MKLRAKSLLIILAAFSGATLLMLVGVRMAAWQGFEHLQEAEALRTVGRAKKLLLTEKDELVRSVADIAILDEFSNALSTANPQMVQEYFSYEVVPNARWTYFAIEDGKGEVLLAREVKARANNVAAPAIFVKALTAQLPPREKIPEEGLGYFGLIQSELYLIGMHPVRSSLKPEKTHGLLIAARRLDDKECARLSAMTDAPVQLALSFEFDGLGNSLPVSQRDDFVIKAEGGLMVGCTILSDLRGVKVAELHAALDSRFREERTRFMVMLACVLVAGAVLLCVLIDRLLIHGWLTRLADLGKGLQDIKRSGSVSDRLVLNGTDELSLLAEETNRLLASIEISHRALEKANAEMQQRVAERTTALADANAALEADISERIKAEQEREQLRGQLLRAHKMEAVGTLAGGIAHDFNNILTGILGHAQLLALDLPPGSPAEANLKQVVVAAERAAMLVKQILAYSRQSPGETHPVSVGQVAREALALLRSALPSGIAIRCVNDAADDNVNADIAQLHQVFMNLGTNAGQAIGAQGGEFEVRIYRATLRSGSALNIPAGEYVRVDVKDTGCGMTPEVLARIFDPFFSTKAVNEGTGLGLAVVQGIISDHGGGIDVVSKVGGGTCFHIWLPAIKVKPAVTAHDSTQIMSGKERILLVDDEEMVLNVLAKGLQRIGYTVDTAPNAIDALEYFKRDPHAYALVVTDQTMPKMSGLQFCAALRSLQSDVPVILSTGYSPEVTGRDAHSLGLAGILGKPVHFSELTQLMRQAIDATKRRAP